MEYKVSGVHGVISVGGDLIFECSWEGYDERTLECPMRARFTQEDMGHVHAFMASKDVQLERDRVRNGVLEHFVRFKHAGEWVEGWVHVSLQDKVSAYSQRMAELRKRLLSDRCELVRQIGFDPYTEQNDFVPGERVQALFRPDRKYYGARVTAVTDDGRFMVEWDDHDKRDAGPKFGCEIRGGEKRISFLEQEIEKLKGEIALSKKRRTSPLSSPQKKRRTDDPCIVLRAALRKAVSDLACLDGDAVNEVASRLIERGTIPKAAVSTSESGESELDLELLGAAQLKAFTGAVQTVLVGKSFGKAESAKPAKMQDDDEMQDDDSSSSGSSLTSDSLC